MHRTSCWILPAGLSVHQRVKQRKCFQTHPQVAWHCRMLTVNLICSLFFKVKQNTETSNPLNLSFQPRIWPMSVDWAVTTARIKRLRKKKCSTKFKSSCLAHISAQRIREWKYELQTANCNLTLRCTEHLADYCQQGVLHIKGLNKEDVLRHMTSSCLALQRWSLKLIFFHFSAKT